MQKFSCKEHIGYALDMFVAEQKDFPIMDELPTDVEELCEYCEEKAAYIVSSK